MEDTDISRRKSQHIKIILDNDVSSNLTTGLEDYAFTHCALPEFDLDEVDTHISFLNKKCAFPLIISSMTGGTEEARNINITLARVANKMGIAMGVGSQRAMINNANLQDTFDVRKYAPDSPLLANLGAVQLNYGYGVEECKKAVESISADGLIFHLNPLQEVLQPEGNTRWSNLRAKIRTVVQNLGYPVIIKEVGWGVSAELVKDLFEMGVYAVDVAGAGGTSWSQVEMYRQNDPGLQQVASSFRNWGIPTAQAVVQAVQAAPQKCIIASGGLKNGIELAKCIGIGAWMGGMAGILIKAAARSEDMLYQKIREIQMEMQISMFCAGIRDLESLHQTKNLIKVTG